MEVSQEIWDELMGVLKDVAVVLEKEDATQEKATMDKPPKAKETAEPMVGGAAPVGKPGTGFAKDAMISMGSNPKKEERTGIKSEGTTVLKKEEVSDEESEGEGKGGESSESEEKKNKDEELKSLLKDIAISLSKSNDVDARIEAGLKKAMPMALDKMLRKMGFTPSRPDVIKLGIEDTGNVRKSDASDTDVDKVDSKEDRLRKAVEDKTRRDWYGDDRELDSFSKKSYQELGDLREKMGGFSAF